MNSVLRSINVNGIRLTYNIYSIKAEFVGRITSGYIIIPQKIFQNLQNYKVNITINGKYSMIQKLVDRKIYIPYEFDDNEVIVRIEVVECQ
jgi:hypothetical protein